MSTQSTAENEIRGLMDTWLTAVRAANVDAIMAVYAPDVIAYDAIGKLQFEGAEAYGAHWKACMEMCQGMIFEPREPTIIANGDVGFSYALIKCGGQDNEGKEMTSWMRMTTGYRKLGGQWKIVHEHFSMPFDMESGKMMADLQP